jgi:hypothetical protein
MPAIACDVLPDAPPWKNLDELIEWGMETGVIGIGGEVGPLMVLADFLGISSQPRDETQSVYYDHLGTLKLRYQDLPMWAGLAGVLICLLKEARQDESLHQTIALLKERLDARHREIVEAKQHAWGYSASGPRFAEVGYPAPAQNYEPTA